MSDDPQTMDQAIEAQQTRPGQPNPHIRRPGMPERFRITINRKAMVNSEPCWEVRDVINGQVGDRPTLMASWGTRKGFVIVRATGGKAWMEYHGQDDDLVPDDGLVIKPANLIDRPRVQFNYLPGCQLERLKTTPGLVFGGVNKVNIRNFRTGATIYAWRDFGLAGMLVPAYRFDGRVQSVTMVPPVVGRPEPLNAWIQVIADGRVGRMEHLTDPA